MALTGIFEADFSAFNDAVKQSTLELTKFETGAADVEKRLNRMGDSFSGKKIIQEATLMAEAIGQLQGGLSSLSDAELARVAKTAGEAVEKMRALGLEVPADIQQLADATGHLRGETDSLGLTVTDLIASYVSAEAIIQLATSAYHLMVDAIKAVITSASEAEQADRKLLAALEAQGTAMPSVLAAYQDYAAALQKTTVYSDDAVTAATALLVQVGGVMPRDMQAALTATTNLAAALGKDLPEAAGMVAKAANGQTQQLEKLGVSFIDTEGHAVDFATAMERVNEKFGGAAAAEADTYAGRLKQLANAWDNVQEAIGRAIVQNQTVQTLIGEVTTLIGNQTGELNQYKEVNNLISEAVILFAQGLRIVAEAANLAYGKVRDFRMVVDLLGVATAAYHPFAAEFSADLTAAAKGSAEWDQGMASLRTEMAAMLERLKATKGGVNELTAAEEENARLKLEQTTQIEEAERKLKAAQAEKEAEQKKLNEAMREYDSLAATTADSLAGMTDATVAGIRADLERGQSQSTLATVYGVTATQIKAIVTVMKEEEQAADRAIKQKQALNRLQLELDRALIDGSRSVMEEQIANIEATAQAQLTAMELAGTATEESYALMAQLSAQLKENVIRDTLEADNGTRASFELRLREAEQYYAQVMQFADQYTAEQIALAAAAVNAAQTDLANWAMTANEHVGAVAAAATGAAQAVGQVNAAVAAGLQQLSTVQSGGTFSWPGMGGSSAGNNQPYAPGRITGPPISLAQQELSKRYGTGAAGLTYNSLRNLEAGNYVTIEGGAFVLNYPIMKDPQAMDALASHVGDAVMAKLTRQGRLA